MAPPLTFRHPSHTFVPHRELQLRLTCQQRKRKVDTKGRTQNWTQEGGSTTGEDRAQRRRPATKKKSGYKRADPELDTKGRKHNRRRNFVPHREAQLSLRCLRPHAVPRSLFETPHTLSCPIGSSNYASDASGRMRFPAHFS